MKSKTLLVISLMLITISVGSSYAPRPALAELNMQDQPFVDAEDLQEPLVEGLFIDSGHVEYDSDTKDYNLLDKLDPAKHGNGTQSAAHPNGFVNGVGINFVATNNYIDYYDGARGCLGSAYNGTKNKTFTFPINVPHGVKGGYIFFTYYNNQSEPANGDLIVYLYRRKYDSIETEQVKKIPLKANRFGSQGLLL